MGFTIKDRNMLIETNTVVKTYEKRLDNLEEEDKLLHHRINKVRNLFGGITATASAAITGIFGYFKFKGG